MKGLSKCDRIKKQLIINPTDIIVTKDSSYPPINLGIFYDFLSNVNKGHIDTIRIISYTFEGIPIVKYLFYDGNKIFYISDSTYSQSDETQQINVYIGDSLIKTSNEDFTIYKLTNYINNSAVNVLAILNNFL
jgi:hypothetical protein